MTATKLQPGKNNQNVKSGIIKNIAKNKSKHNNWQSYSIQMEIGTQHIGDIVWANLDPSIGNEPQGLRPVLVLSQKNFYLTDSYLIAGC